jgi:glycosyltransferase involved in cell wall biosynthesis
LKIAYISTNDTAPWGGSEDLWFESAKQFRKEGHDIVVNVKKWPDDTASIKVLEEIGCKITRRGKRYQKYFVLDKLKRRLKSLYHGKPANIYSVVYEWLVKAKPGFAILSLEMNTSGFTYMNACINANIPYVLIIQSAGEFFWPGERSSLNLLEGYTHAKKCFFVSRANLRLTEKQLACFLHNAYIVRNPFKVTYRVPFSWPDESVFNFACVGRLEVFAKGQDILFEALSSEKWRNRKIRINLYGKGGNEQGLRRLCRLWDLDKLINFAGFVTNIEEIWQKNHALILASRFEGLPIAIVEAMLCGRVCIVTNVAGNAELLEDNVTGFVADAPRAKALDEAMERGWQSRISWNEIGKRAYLQVREFIPEEPAAEFNKQVKSLFPSEIFDSSTAHK